jgi:hypothetical protein
MPWKSRPTTGAIAGNLQRCAQTCDGASLTLQSIDAAGVVRQLRADGKGWFGAIELSPGTYQLKVDASQIQQTVNVVAGDVTKINLGAS